MSRATHAILKHYSSTLENPNHEDCPAGKNSWCSYNRDVASGTNYHQPIKNSLPPAVVAEIQPLFDRLGSKEFLANCEDGKTQNVNESYHHVVWNLAPKEQLNSPLEIKLAVEIATLLFNSGMKSTYNSIFIDAGTTVSENMLLQWEDMDNKWKQEKLWKQKEETKSKTKTLNEETSNSNKRLSILRISNINLVLFIKTVLSNISNYIFLVYYENSMHFYWMEGKYCDIRYRSIQRSW